ncbi:hypothetical protein AWRI1631_51930 [Saccharomyces cerevisiae AWRI1631]|uniref:Uncharacterized protein n=1 Tax=Saccharomyces cerevisiae (strain AWRI1631) TaxID=545124 RepID=B5VHQ5_YEAS6|nr:hypothetical protein AWRI1631_51930 [Saccharomyces cerevisiae AWRI1631]
MSAPIDALQSGWSDDSLIYSSMACIRDLLLRSLCSLASNLSSKCVCCGGRTAVIFGGLYTPVSLSSFSSPFSCLAVSSTLYADDFLFVLIIPEVFGLYAISSSLDSSSSLSSLPL